jgi:hypothetical protein
MTGTLLETNKRVSDASQHTRKRGGCLALRELESLSHRNLAVPAAPRDTSV